MVLDSGAGFYRLLKVVEFILMGFIILAEDSLGIIPEDTLSFFQKREKVFKHIWENEENWLRERYQVDPLYWKKPLEELDTLYSLDLSDLSYQLYRSDRLDWLYLSNLSNPSYLQNLLNLRYLSVSYLPHQSYRSYQSDLSNRSYLSNRSFLSDWSDRSNRSNRSDRSNLSDLSNLSNLSDQSDQSDWSDRSDRSYRLLQSAYYEVAKERIKATQKHWPTNFINYNDTLTLIPWSLYQAYPIKLKTRCAV